MENTSLTFEDWNMIYESLKYTKLKFEDYQLYPSQEFKQKRIEEVARLMQKISAIKAESKKS